jgi:beta-glucosidase
MEGRTYRYFRGEPLFPFGHGLSYARFTYANLRLPAATRGDAPVVVSVAVTNTGTIEAEEVVQLYVARDAAGAPVPQRSLAGIRRVTLRPGERRRVRFEVPARHLAIVGEDGRRTLAPGVVTVSVGGKQPGQRGLGDAATTEVVGGRVTVTGPAR